MSGIAGIVDYSGQVPSQTEVLRRMSQRLTHRGPDGNGLWAVEHMAFAHRRLVTLDGEGGKQPLTRRVEGRTYTVMLDGNVYNAEELKQELQGYGYSFQGYSEAETVLYAYIQWGEDFVHRLNGVFAIALADVERRTVLLIRDHMGVKPLFYCLRRGALIFASELKALLAHPQVEAVVDRQGLREVLALGPCHTAGCGIYRDVYEVEPGQMIRFTPQGLEKKIYWRLESKPHEDSFEQTVEKVRDLLVDTVHRQLRSETGVEAFLSGGLDSSAITAIAATFLKEKGEKLHTFSLDYAGSEEHFQANAFQPERDGYYIDTMVKNFETQHHSYVIPSARALADSIEKAVLMRDLPGMGDVDSSLMLGCGEVRRTAGAVLSGECADEVFGGYPWCYRPELVNTRTFPWMLNIDEKLSVVKPELVNELDLHGYIDDAYAAALAQVPHLAGENSEQRRKREIFYLNQRWFGAMLIERKDRMSMAVSLNARMPFCDRRLVEYAWNIPFEMKHYRNQEKGLLREALRGILPEEVAYRKKSPFPKTYDPQYERIVKTWLTDIINDPASPLLQIIDKGALEEKMNKKNTPYLPWFGQLMSRPQLYAYLIQTDIWLRANHIRIVL